MTKKKTLVKESVIRRWGKLANMQPLTENWLDTINEEDVDQEEEEAAHDEEKAHDEMDYAAGDLERAGESEGAMLDPDVAEDIAAELVATLSDKLSDLAGGAEVIDIVDDEDDMDLGDDEVEMDMEIEMDDEVAMGDHAYNRHDLYERGGRAGDKDNEPGEEGRVDFSTKKLSRQARKDDKTNRAPKRGAQATRKKGTKNDGYIKNRQDEELDVEMIDDEALTEAVLARVVERLLSKN